MSCSGNKLYESFFPMDYEKLYPFLHQNFFSNKNDGVFVEFGAHNGLGCTKYFEDLGWQGICIEPHPILFEELKKNRKAICLNCAISNENKSSKFLQINYPGPDCLSGIYTQRD
jgi:hypothetical protein